MSLRQKILSDLESNGVSDHFNETKVLSKRILVLKIERKTHTRHITASKKEKY